jgi:hypothetical protein
MLRQFLWWSFSTNCQTPVGLKGGGIRSLLCWD